MISNVDKKIMQAPFNDLWEFVKDTYEIESGEEYWQHLIARARELSRKYEKMAFSHTINVVLLDYMADCERRRSQLPRT
jgi:hypothetical protein